MRGAVYLSCWVSIQRFNIYYQMSYLISLLSNYSFLSLFLCLCSAFNCSSSISCCSKRLPNRGFLGRTTNPKWGHHSLQCLPSQSEWQQAGPSGHILRAWEYCGFRSGVLYRVFFLSGGVHCTRVCGEPTRVSFHPREWYVAFRSCSWTHIFKLR